MAGSLFNKVNVCVTITGDWLETINSPLVYIDELIKKSREHQRSWKRMSPKLAKEVRIDRQEMIVFFKHVETTLIVIRGLYYISIIGILRVINIFRDVFGI